MQNAVQCSPAECVINISICDDQRAAQSVGQSYFWRHFYTNLFIVFTHHNQYHEKVYGQDKGRYWIKRCLK